MHKSELKLQNVLSYIEQADDYDTNYMIGAIIHRYGVNHPDWEIAFMTFRKDPASRDNDIDRTIRFLEGMRGK